MFVIGRSQHTMDSKGRIVLPVRYREQLDSTLYITIGMGNYISIYNPDGFQEFRDIIAKTPNQNQKRVLEQAFYYNTEELEFDKANGRVLIPVHLREHAGLIKDVVIAGSGNRLDIWDLEKFNNNKEKVNIQAVSDVFDSVNSF